MSPEVGPKNTNKRKRNTSDWIPEFSKYLPQRFYLREMGCLVAVMVLLGVAYDFYNFIHNHPQYKPEIVVKGLKKLESQQVINKIPTFRNSSNHASLISLNVSAIETALQSRMPRFRSVQVQKEYPDRLIISVEERRPVALLARVGERSRRIYLPVSLDGVVFPPTKEEAERLPDEVPLVKGLESVTPGSERFDRQWDFVRQVLEAADEKFSQDRLNWVKVRTGGYVEIQIKRPKKLKIRLGVGNYSQKFAKLQKMMRTEQFMEINRYVNLSNLDNIRVL